MAKKKKLSLETWLRQDRVLGYVINAYAGVDESPNQTGVLRRVFLWEEDDDVIMGNTEAFVLHLGRRFDRRVKEGDATAIHRLLRDLGENVALHRKHDSPRADSPRVGRYKQPDPEEWRIRRGDTPSDEGE